VRAEAFFEEVPRLFRASRPRWEKAYEALLYAVRRPLTRANVEDIVTWLDGGKLGRLGPRELEALNTVLLRLRWPDVRPLARLRGIEGMTLPRACALLHFHNPSFPSFQPGAVRGLALLGRRVRRPEALGLDEVRAYRRHMDHVADLKERIPYRCVPESHYFHSWVLEVSLAELARDAPGREASTR
jgi:hypothetical protein